MKFFAFLLVAALAQNAIAGPLDKSPKDDVPVIFHPFLDLCHSIGEMFSSIITTTVKSGNFLRVPSCMPLFKLEQIPQDQMDKSLNCIDNLGSILDKVLAKLPQEQIQFLQRVQKIHDGGASPNFFEMLQLSQQARQFFRASYNVVKNDPDTNKYFEDVVKCTNPLLDFIRADFQKATDTVNKCISQ